MTFTHAVSTNNYGPYKWIVSDTATGTHTTLGTALTSASAGDTIYLRKSVTENVTLKNGVNIVGPEPCTVNTANNITITGKLIDNGGAVTCTIINIELTTNSDNILSLTNAGSIINLESCYLTSSTTTLINFGAAASVISTNCYFSTVGAFSICTTTGTLNFYYCYLSGNSETAMDCVNGSITFYWCNVTYHITISGSGTLLISNSVVTTAGSVVLITFTSTGSLTCYNSLLTGGGATVLSFASSSTAILDNCSITAFLNQNVILTSSTAQVTAYNCFMKAGSTSVISIGTGTTVTIANCVIDSTNTNAITGAGTLNYGGTSFSNTSRTINTTTQSDLDFNTFTPVLNFGGATTGITYTNQNGWYQRKDSMCSFSIYINLSSKGSATGNATITGLPFTSSANNNMEIPMVTSNVTQAGAAYGDADLQPGTSSLTLFGSNLTGPFFANLTNAHFANNSVLRLQGFYFI